MNIAIIPARGGSKRLPGKNIKPFIGRPIISYSIETARKSGLFNRVIVSTDSEEIAGVARAEGAEVPFMRPRKISDDYSPVGEAVHHALTWLNDNGCSIKYACCIFSTAPFIRIDDLKKGLDIITHKKVDSVFTVTTFPFPIFRAMKITKSGNPKMFWPEHELTRSNDLPEAYHDAGQFYWLDAGKFLSNKRFFTPDALPVILPRYLVQDIDTPEDWDTAELLYAALAKRKPGCGRNPKGKR